jgi:hypothetical protein
MLIQRVGPLFCGVQRSVMTRLSVEKGLLKHEAVIWSRSTMDIMGDAPSNTRFIFLSVPPVLRDRHENVTLIDQPPQNRQTCEQP